MANPSDRRLQEELKAAELIESLETRNKVYKAVAEAAIQEAITMRTLATAKEVINDSTPAQPKVIPKRKERSNFDLLAAGDSLIGRVIITFKEMVEAWPWLIGIAIFCLIVTKGNIPYAAALTVLMCFILFIGTVCIRDVFD